MKNNPEEIPSEIFEWMQLYTFEALNRVQQEKVLLHFQKEEYDEFCSIHHEVKKVTVFPPTENKVEIGKNLFNRFDEKFKTKRTGILNRQVVFWKAAAIFIFLLTLVSYAYILKKPGEVVTKWETVTDTVYITKKSSTSPEKIHDTIYIYKEKNIEKEDRANKRKQENPFSNVTGNLEIPEEGFNEAEVISVSEFENELNGTKNNSRKDDSLSKAYSLITL